MIRRTGVGPGTSSGARARFFAASGLFLLLAGALRGSPEPSARQREGSNPCVSRSFRSARRTISRRISRTPNGASRTLLPGARDFVALPENFAYMRREGGRFPCAQGTGRRDRSKPLRDVGADAFRGSGYSAGPSRKRSRAMNASTTRASSDLARRAEEVGALPQGPPLRRVTLGADAGGDYRESTSWFAARGRAGRGRDPLRGQSVSASVTTCVSPSSTAPSPCAAARFLNRAERLHAGNREGPLGGTPPRAGHRDPRPTSSPRPSAAATPPTAPSHGRSLIIDPWGLVLAAGRGRARGDRGRLSRRRPIDRARSAHPGARASAASPSATDLGDYVPERPALGEARQRL